MFFGNKFTIKLTVKLTNFKPSVQFLASGDYSFVWGVAQNQLCAYLLATQKAINHYKVYRMGNKIKSRVDNYTKTFFYFMQKTLKWRTTAKF